MATSGRACPTQLSPDPSCLDHLGCSAALQKKLKASRTLRRGHDGEVNFLRCTPVQTPKALAGKLGSRRRPRVGCCGRWRGGGREGSPGEGELSGLRHLGCAHLRRAWSLRCWRSRPGRDTPPAGGADVVMAGSACRGGCGRLDLCGAASWPANAPSLAPLALGLTAIGALLANSDASRPPIPI
jgi:hypothetical protein